MVQGGHPYVADFSIWYAAGKLATMAMQAPTNVYDIQIQDSVLRSVIAPVVPELPWSIHCAPPVFLLASIFPLVGLTTSWAVYCVLGDLCFLSVLYLLIKEDLHGRYDFAMIALAVCASFPFWVCNRTGQPTLITASATMLMLHFLRHKRPFLAGLPTALFSFKLQYLPFLGLTGVALGGWKFLCASGITYMMLAALSGSLLGWPNVLNYPGALVQGESSHQFSGVRIEDQQNIRSLIVRLTHSESDNKLCVALCLLVAFLLFGAWVKPSFKELKGVAPEDRFKFLSTLTLICMLVFSPHAHKQDYLLLAVPAAWIWLALRNDAARAKRWAWILVVSLPIISWVLFIFDPLSPVPTFIAVAPLLIVASWKTFITRNQSPVEAAKDAS